MLTPADDAALRDLEAGMWQQQRRGDRAWTDAHLAPEFVEFGASGRRWSRDDCLNIEISDLAAQLRETRVTALGDDHALVTYLIDHGRSVRSRRSSVWVRTAPSWQLLFHQGTPVPADLL